MSVTWTNGYQTDVNYTYGYYKDLSPSYQRFCLLLNGVDSPPSNEQHTHCELGFGQGVSINVHAAASESIYWGTDFNPAHAAHANQLAEHSKVQHHFFDDSFEELLNRADLPQFNSISLHGIWSWISYENQLIILKFIRHYLKPSGIVYLSYNCMTGWASNVPIRELLYSHFKFNSKSHDPTQKVKDALQFSEALIEQDPIYAQRNQQAKQKLNDLKKQNPNYLIHEYLNQDWQCFSFQQVVRLFEEIKLSFAGSTDLNKHIANINLTEEQQVFLNKIEHPVFQEQCLDYFMATQFRRDLFVRGEQKLTPLQVKERLRATYFVILNKTEHLPKTITGYLGEFNLIEEIYQKIGEKFTTEKYRPLTLRTLEDSFPNLNYEKILNALVVLCHLGYAQPCQNPAPSDQVLEQCHNLNKQLLSEAKFHANYQVLMSPLTGIAVPVNHLNQLFYAAYYLDGLKTEQLLAEYVQTVFDNLGLLLLSEQQEAINDPKESLKILKEKAQKFLSGAMVEIANQLRFFA